MAFTINKHSLECVSAIVQFSKSRNCIEGTCFEYKVALILIAQVHKEERNYKLEQLNDSYLHHPIFILKLIPCLV